MKQFETEGRFWLPNNPDATIPGRLKWEKDGGSELMVSGALDRERQDIGDRQSVVHGVVENTPYSLGRMVTLWNPYLAGRTTSSIGLTRERYRAQVLVAGEHLGDESEVRFHSAELRYSSLGEWAHGYSGLRAESEFLNGKHIRSHRTLPPDALPIPCDGVSLSLYTSTMTSQKHRHYEMTEEVILEVVPTDPLTLAELTGRYIYPLQNFLTLAMNAPAGVERLVCHLPEEEAESQGVDISYARYFMPQEGHDVERHYRSLFYLQHVRDRLPQVFNNWLAASARLRDALNMYFGVQYTPRLFVDWRFQTVLHALTLYGLATRLDRPGDPLVSRALESLPPDAASHLAKLLNTSLLLNAEGVLTGLHAEHGSEIEWLFGREPSCFDARVLNTYYHLQYRDPVNSLAGATEDDLYELTEATSWLIKLCLLKEIGFSKQERADLIMNNQDAQRIKGEFTRINDLPPG